MLVYNQNKFSLKNEDIICNNNYIIVTLYNKKDKKAKPILVTMCNGDITKLFNLIKEDYISQKKKIKIILSNFDSKQKQTKNPSLFETFFKLSRKTKKLDEKDKYLLDKFSKKGDDFNNLFYANITPIKSKKKRINLPKSNYNDKTYFGKYKQFYDDFKYQPIIKKFTL